MSNINKMFIPVSINGYDSEYILRDYGKKIVISVSVDSELEQNLVTCYSPQLLDYLRDLGNNQSTIIEISNDNCITLLDILSFPF